MYDKNVNSFAILTLKRAAVGSCTTLPEQQHSSPAVNTSQYLTYTQVLTLFLCCDERCLSAWFGALLAASVQTTTSNLARPKVIRHKNYALQRYKQLSQTACQDAMTQQKTWYFK